MQVSVFEKYNSNEAPPTEHLSALIEKYTGSWGFAYIEAGQFHMAGDGSEKCDLDWVLEVMTSTLDKTRFLFLSQAAGENQPYVLVTDPKDADGAQVISMLAGHFFPIKHENPDNTDSNENVLANSWMKPKVNRLLGFMNGDLGKLMEELRDVSTERDFLGQIDTAGSGGGSIMVAAANGDTAVFSTPGAIKSFPWGITTDGIGLEAEAVPAEVKAPTAMDRFKKGAEKVIASVTPIRNKPADAATEMVKWKPAPNSPLAFKQQAYKALTGTIPRNVDDDPEIMVDKKRLDHCVAMKWKFKNIKSFEDLAGLRGTMQLPTSAAPPAAEPPAAPPPPPPAPEVPVKPKDVTTKNVPTVKPVDAPLLPILDAAQLKAILDGPVLKTLDKNSLKIDDPKGFQKLEETYPTLFAQLGREDHNPVYPYEGLIALQNLHPEAVAILAFHALIKARKSELLEADLTTTIEGLQTKLHETGIGVLNPGKNSAMAAFGKKKAG